MSGPEQETVVLVHGFFRTARDMRPLQRFLGAMGFHVLTMDLPTTFGTMEQCAARLERFFGTLQLPPGPVHFVGHSMGGLVSLAFLARNRTARPGRCVLIASPVNGSSLADRAHAFSRTVTRVFKGLDSLRTGSVSRLDTRAAGTVDIGVIAGTTGCLLTGVFLSPPHDGRIELASTRFAGSRDNIELPYSHTRIHKKRDTAERVAVFLRTGSFRRQ